MKKLINAVEDVLAESLDGFAATHADIVELGPERKFIRRRAPKPGTGAWISAIGRPSFSCRCQCDGKHRMAPVSA